MKLYKDSTSHFLFITLHNNETNFGRNIKRNNLREENKTFKEITSR